MTGQMWRGSWCINSSQVHAALFRHGWLFPEVVKFYYFLKLKYSSLEFRETYCLKQFSNILFLLQDFTVAAPLLRALPLPSYGRCRSPPTGVAAPLLRALPLPSNGRCRSPPTGVAAPLLRALPLPSYGRCRSPPLRVSLPLDTPTTDHNVCFFLIRELYLLHEIL